jgi:hypothetical protein
MTSPVRAGGATDALDHRFDNPSEELLWQIISGLTASHNYFVMVQHVPDSSEDGTYIQTAVVADGLFTVEYQDRDLQHHFHGEIDNVRQAYEVVVACGFRHPEWGKCSPGSLKTLASSPSPI